MKNATMVSCCRAVRITTVVMSMPRPRSMYTVRNGRARLTAKFHEVRNQMRFLKLTSWKGCLSSSTNGGIFSTEAICGSGILEICTMPSMPAMNPATNRMVYATSSSSGNVAIQTSTKYPASRAVGMATAVDSSIFLEKNRPRTDWGTRSCIHELKLHPPTLASRELRTSAARTIGSAVLNGTMRGMNAITSRNARLRADAIMVMDRRVLNFSTR